SMYLRLPFRRRLSRPRLFLRYSCRSLVNWRPGLYFTRCSATGRGVRQRVGPNAANLRGTLVFSHPYEFRAETAVTPLGTYVCDLCDVSPVRGFFSYTPADLVEND